METLLYVDDFVVDIAYNQTVALTLQRVDVGDITKNFVTYSNTIRALNTERNNVKFRYANLEKSEGRFQYSLQNCKIVQNGVEIITGVCLIRSVDAEYEIVVYDDFLSFNSFLSGKQLSDLPWETQDWRNAAIDTARTKTSDFISAVLNWGQTSIYEFNRFFPSYFYKDVIQKIMGLTGFTISGAILNNPDYTDLICTPFRKFTYQAPGYVKLTVPTNSTNTFFNASGDVIMPMPPDVVPLGLIANLRLTVNFTSITFTKGGGSTSSVQCRIVGNIAGVWGGTPTITSNTSGTFVFDFFDIDTIAVQRLEIQILYTKDAAFPGDNVTVITFAPSCSISVIDTLKINRNIVRWKELANNINLSDILKDFFVRFGIVYKKDGNAILLRTLQEICADTAGAVDWTAKRVKAKDKQSFTSSYAQQNRFLYSDQAKDKLLGVGILSILNTTLKAAQDFFQSIFNNAARWAGVGYEVMTIPAYISNCTFPITLFANSGGALQITVTGNLTKNDEDNGGTVSPNSVIRVFSDGVYNGLFTVVTVTDATNSVITFTGGTFVSAPGSGYIQLEEIDEMKDDVPFCIGTLKDRTTEAAITFHTSARTDYKLAYFSDLTLLKDSGFQYFIDKHYPLFSKALQDYKVVNHKYALTEIDIASYDPHKMIFDNGSYYLINKISNYQSGKVTDVELFKIQ